MKYLIAVLTIYLFCMADCTVKAKFSSYTITNQSGTTVEIIPFIRDTVMLNYKVTIANTNNISVHGKTIIRHHMSELVEKNIPIGNTANKLEFVFNNSKKIIYDLNKSQSQPRNIYNTSYNDERVEEYIITAEDYANAIPCNGNCY